MLRFVLREGRRWWLSTAALASGVALTLIVVRCFPGKHRPRRVRYRIDLTTCPRRAI